MPREAKGQRLDTSRKGLDRNIVLDTKKKKDKKQKKADKKKKLGRPPLQAQVKATNYQVPSS